MNIKGKVQDPYCHKYPEFRHRKVLEKPIPDMREPPNHQPSRPTMNTVELADYEITMSAVDDDNWSTVRLTMLPNEYTQATEPRTVVEFKAAHTSLLYKTYVDKAMRLAFG